jgi:hypothetical protein
MTDRELLEAAAKAAGELYTEPAPEGGLYLSNSVYWNPLTNDGDALRLAVELGLFISHSTHKPGETSYGFVGIAWYGQRVEFESEKFTDDPYAATRRAIVRAAVEIGKGEK